MKKQEVLRVKDEILSAVLASVASNPVFNESLVFQGGGALHFIYGSPRYSNDLDFVCGGLDGVREDIVGELCRGVLVGQRLLVPVVRAEGNLIRAAYSFGDGQPSGKLEIYAQKSFDNAPTSGRFSPLRVESPSEIYADKIVATLARMGQRGSLKPTDLFDMDYIVSHLSGGVSPGELADKAATYGEAEIVTPEGLERVARFVRDPKLHEGFRTVIGKSLMPDYFEHARIDSALFDAVSSYFEKHAAEVRAFSGH